MVRACASACRASVGAGAQDARQGDADGEILGLYRKSHIPDGPGYQEKYYFRPGDTGFKAWKTRYGTIGAGICWDQWYPEAARAMVLQGAEILAMQGHAVANAVPVIAANRVGVEANDGVTQSYYGHSFIADHTGELVESLGDKDEGVLVHAFDLGEIERYRAEGGFFRDRRTDLYAKALK
jgi:N-carbamoylputrescine amidase